MWNPTLYGRYRAHRDRPFHDLLTAVDVADPQYVADLGCGTGELTASMAERWPAATVVGIDTSTTMLDRAMELRTSANLSFQLADIATWEPKSPVDLLVSNAALHWLPDHPVLIPRLAALVAPGGWLAVQMPGNFDAPSHTILRELCNSARWRAKLGGDAGGSAAVRTPAWYAETLLDLGFEVNVWETTYLQLLRGDDPVLEWMKGTALRPVLAVLDATERRAFLAQYGQRLRTAYPPGDHGTMFPFRRIFVVACRR